MRFCEYKKKYNLNFDELAIGTGIPRSTVARLVSNQTACLKMKHAKRIVEWTKGEVTYEDLANSQS